MNTSGNKSSIGLALSTQIAFLLAVSLLLWSMGAPSLLQRAHASNLTLISDTLSTSNLGVPAKHTITFTTPTLIQGGQTIVIGIAPGGAPYFSEIGSPATSTDILVGTSTPTGYNVAASCTTGNQATAVANYNTGTGNDTLTLTFCAGIPTTIATGTPITITVGAVNKLWTNPITTGSYRITLGGTQGAPLPSSGETRVAVLPNVTLTANVATAFTFTVTGLATTTGFYGNLATTTASTTATSLPFSTLVPSSVNILGQQLNVSTNARNGFAVTVQENQPPTSSTGATIDLFSNGATTSTPIVWTAPTSILNVPSTYGHFGITSDDILLNSNEFLSASTTKWAGNIDQPRVVFSAAGPADGTTQNFGTARVGYRIEIGPLQEAGNDYTNTITYVATPTF